MVSGTHQRSDRGTHREGKPWGFSLRDSANNPLPYSPETRNQKLETIKTRVGSLVDLRYDGRVRSYYLEKKQARRVVHDTAIL